MDDIEWLKQLAQYAGPVALAAFAGTFLGGIALSFFWKNFGPWKLLEAAREECRLCHLERERESLNSATRDAKLADLQARYDIIMHAMERGGLGLQLGPEQYRSP